MAKKTKAAPKRPTLKDDVQFARQIRDARRNVNALIKAQVSGTFLDCGANIGEVSIALAPFCGRVIAVEAHPDTAKVAERRIKAAGLSNVEVINAAVTAVTGEVVNVSSPSPCAIGATARATPRHKDAPAGYYKKVRTVSFSNLIRTYHPSAIKMDIEGSEFEALDGIKLPKSVKNIVVEFHGKPDRIAPIVKGIVAQGFRASGFNPDTTYTLQTVQFARSK